MEFCRRYSNCPDLLGALVSELEKIKNDVPHDDELDLAPARGNKAGMWCITDRFSSSGVDISIASYRTGGMTRLLAEWYSVSTTTIKRLLHDHGVRKQRPRFVADVTDSFRRCLPEGVDPSQGCFRAPHLRSAASW